MKIHLILKVSLISVILLIIFLSLEYYLPDVLKLDNKWIFISSLPILTIFIYCGYIKKFKVLGLEIETHLKPISQSFNFGKILLEEVKSSSKDSSSHLKDLTKKHQIQVLKFKMEKKGYYREENIMNYIKELKNLKYIEIINKDNKFIALLKISQIFNKKEIDEKNLIHLKSFIYNLENGYLDSYSCNRNYLTKETNLLDAYSKIITSNSDFLPVIDNFKLVSILTKNELSKKISDSILNLSKSKDILCE